MRISDWSSDVCSSDLIGVDHVLRGELGIAAGLSVHVSGVGDVLETGHGVELADEGLRRHGVEEIVELVEVGERLGALGHVDEELLDVGLHLGDQRLGLDRKSAEEVKSVSVRVDLGGLRIIKKKK